MRGARSFAQLVRIGKIGRGNPHPGHNKSESFAWKFDADFNAVGWQFREEMKREAVGHSKMKRLCKILDIPLPTAVGILELLWHLAAREAPQGNIGKLSNEEIALALDYGGDPNALVKALETARWLDRSSEHRLVVHDWHEHADEAVKKRLHRNQLPFLSVHVEIRSASVGTCPENGSLPEPEPEPEPEPGAGAEPTHPPAPPTFVPVPDPDAGAELALASWALEEIGVPSDHTIIRIAGEAIRLLAKEGGTVRDAAEYIIAQGREARCRGETVNRFWFSDQRYRPLEKPKTRKQRALEEAVANFTMGEV